MPPPFPPAALLAEYLARSDEGRHGQVVPGGRIAAPMKAHMPARRRQERRQVRVPAPVEFAIGGGRNPRVVERVDHQGRDRDAAEIPQRLASFVIVAGAGEAVARGDEHLVEAPDRTRRHDRPAFARVQRRRSWSLLSASHCSAITALALEHQRIPPTLNYTPGAEGCDLDYVGDGPRDAKLKYAMTNSFGFGGQNSVLVLKKA